MKVIACEQGSARWEQARLGYVTASALDKIISPKKLQVSSQASGYLNRIVAEWILGYPIDTGTGNYGQPWMERGTRLEDEARRLYQFENDVRAERVGFVLTDDEHLGGSPDSLIGSDGIIEIKCPLIHTHIGYLLEPTALVDAYRGQVQGYLYITGREWADVISYCPDLPPLIQRVYPEPEYHRALDVLLPVFNERLREAKERFAEHRIVREVHA